MHVEQSQFRQIELPSSIASLLATCVDSAQTVLRTLRVIGDEDLLDAFLPFNAEDAFSSAFILFLIRAISPDLLEDDKWFGDARHVLDKMIAKGSVVAPLRKLELNQLEQLLVVFTPLGEDLAEPLQNNFTDQPQEFTMALDDSSWDFSATMDMINMSPRQLMDLAEQLNFTQLEQPVI